MVTIWQHCRDAVSSLGRELTSYNSLPLNNQTTKQTKHSISKDFQRANSEMNIKENLLDTELTDNTHASFKDRLNSIDLR